MALVIKQWSATATPDSDGVFIHIAGRESGLLSWLLSLIGVDPTTEITVHENKIVFQKRVIPIAKV